MPPDDPNEMIPVTLDDGTVVPMPRQYAQWRQNPMSDPPVLQDIQPMGGPPPGAGAPSAPPSSFLGMNVQPQPAAPVAPSAPPPMVPPPSPGIPQSGGASAGGSWSGYTADIPPPSVNLPPQYQRAVDEDRQGMTDADQATQNAYATQSKAVADENNFMNGTDAKGNLLPTSGAGQLQAERDRALQDRQDFESHAAEAVSQKSAMIQQRIAQIPAEDPAKMWQGTEGGFARASGILASAIGGLLAVSTGSGRNLGLEALQKTIDTDIASQRANIEGEWKKVAQDNTELDRFRSQLGDERAWHAEQAAYRYASLAARLDAQMGTFKSASKQAEIAGLAASMHQQTMEHALRADEFNSEMASKVVDRTMQRWEKQVEFSKISESERLAANAAAGQNPNGTVYGNLPHTHEDIYSPLKLPEGEATKLRTDAGDFSDFATNSQAVMRMMNSVGRMYNGPGGTSRVYSTADREQLRAAFGGLAWDQIVKKLGTTATDKAVKSVYQTMTGTGELPGGSFSVGSGDLAAFKDWARREQQSRGRQLIAKKVRLVNPTTGESRSAEELLKEADDNIEAAGAKHDETAGVKDPMDIANVAMTKIRSPKTAQDVADGFRAIDTVNARNSQGDQDMSDVAG